MRWPWKRPNSDQRLVVSWSQGTLAYVLAREQGRNQYTVLAMGVQRRCGDDLKSVVRQLKAFELEGLEVQVMLRPEQYQLLQIETPAVAPEELRAAARYQIQGLLDLPVADVTLDLIRVGDGRQPGPGHLLVAAAAHVVLGGVLRLVSAMRWTVSVIDIYETTQRNLQTAFSVRLGGLSQAHAALIWLSPIQAVLTISAQGELFYTRKLDLPPGLTASLDTATSLDENQLVDLQASQWPAADDRLWREERVSPSPELHRPEATARTLVTPAERSLNDSPAQRFLTELQRSFDLWERLWPMMPIELIWLHAGSHTDALSQWLGSELGQKVMPMDIRALFPGFEGTQADETLCLPLLGVLLRTEDRTL